MPVLLLRTNRYPLHHGTLGAIRTLGRAGIEVHAIVEPGLTPAATSRHLDRGHPWGPSPESPRALADHLRDIAERIGRVSALVPLDDAGAIFIAENAGALHERFVFPKQESAVPRLVADKASLLSEAHRNDITVPLSRIPRDRGQLRAAVAELGLPLIMKWARPWLLSEARRSTTFVTTARQAERIFDASASEDAGPLVLQKRIRPEGGDWFFQGYFDVGSCCLFGGTGRKHAARPARAGHTIAGEWVHNHQLEELAQKVVQILGHTGLVDLDFRFERETGRYHLLDFNPRLGAQFRLFHDRQGLDPLRTLHLDLSGRPIPRQIPGYGRSLIVENHYLQQALARPARTPSALRRARRADELAWWARDDPRPFLTMGRLSLKSLSTRGAVRNSRSRKEAS
ncbi:ATP-grasp domain-containing protein [Spirillospora sp. CA-294931]|uniref:carboxylate--amine ligase n=1 Tax=Spirillospora sp. CA-294931 TaxID=3240042 RepID=UPI003D8CD540